MRNSNVRIQQIILIVAAISCCATTANAQRYASTPAGKRDYAGDRYLALANVQVYLKPDTSSRIIYDLPRQRLLYAEATGRPGWLAIRGAGSADYPYFWSQNTVAIFENGRFDPPDGTDYDSYFPQIGFVRSESLVDLDAPDPATEVISTLSTAPVPNNWASLGLPDDRRFVTNGTVAPFNSVARLETIDGAGRWSYCSGFFFGKVDVFVSAGHCAADEKKFFINIDRGKFGKEKIEAQLVKSAYIQDSDDPDHPLQDWAVFKLSHPPHLTVVPLRLAPPAFLASHGQFTLMEVGYPSDLLTESVEEQGYWTAAISTCRANASDFLIKPAPSGWRDELQDFCTGTPGSSGSPVMVWNDYDRQFEVVGIRVYSNASFPGVFTDPALDAINRKARSLMAPRSFSSIMASYAFRASRFQPMGPDDNVAQFTELLIPGSGVLLAYSQYISGFNNFGAVALFNSQILAAANLAGASVPEYTLAEFQPPISGLSYPNPDLMPMTFAGLPPGSDIVQYARVFCASNCTAAVLAPGSQLRLGLGDLLPPSTFEPNQERLAVQTDNSSSGALGYLSIFNAAMFIQGGDLIVYNTETHRIEGIARAFMGLLSEGEDLFKASRFLCGACDTDEGRPEESSVPSTTGFHAGELQGETPLKLPGATTINPFQAWHLIQEDSPTIISLAPGVVGVPGSVQVNTDGDAGSFNDNVQQSLETTLNRLTKGSMARPIIVYGDSAQNWFSYNVTLRIINAGYRNIYWMRQGLYGWVTQGYPLGYKDIASSN